MAKKAKAATALNWRTGDGYPEHGERTDLWAWEFLRRNPKYIADWRRFLAVADELRGSYAKPYDNLPDNWESDPARPYWIISKAAEDGDMRARVYDPPAQDGETEGEYYARMRATGVSSFGSRPLAGAMGQRWGLDMIADPALPRLGLLHKWGAAPYGVSSPGEHRSNHEGTWVHYLNHIAELLRADPLPPDALQSARASLEQVPAAWEKRLSEMGEDRPEKRGRFVLEFDLRVSIPEQLKHAADWLEHEQSAWKKGGGEVLSSGRRNKETPGYATYLRALDAVNEIGEANGTSWRSGIAAAMIPGYQQSAKYDDRKPDLDKVGAWVKRAAQLRDGEYRRLVAMTNKPTFSEMESTSQRRK